VGGGGGGVGGEGGRGVGGGEGGGGGGGVGGWGGVGGGGGGEGWAATFKQTTLRIIAAFLSFFKSIYCYVTLQYSTTTSFPISQSYYSTISSLRICKIVVK